MRPVALACAAALACGLAAAGAPAGAQTASVAALEAQLNLAGRRLEQATEAYNQARLRRQRLDARLAAAQQDLARSQARLDAEKRKLAVAVRNLYMHPAGGLGTFFAASSYGEFERGSAFAGRAFLSTDSLILRIRRARAEEADSAARLKALRDQARSQELQIAAERRAAAAAYAHTQDLLHRAGVEAALEAERQAQLRQAAALALSRIHFAGPVSPAAAVAVRTAAAQIGKPYRWGAAGPDAFDCSGLTMYAWAAAGVSLPHSAAAQQSMLPRVPLDQLAPGDLVFAGDPAYHVAIYEGGGKVIAAPHTGDYVKEESVWAINPTNAGRP